MTSLCAFVFLSPFCGSLWSDSGCRGLRGMSKGRRGRRTRTGQAAGGRRVDAGTASEVPMGPEFPGNPGVKGHPSGYLTLGHPSGYLTLAPGERGPVFQENTAAARTCLGVGSPSNLERLELSIGDTEGPSHSDF